MDIPVINTSATVFPRAAFAAALRSLSLSEEETVDPSDLDLLVIASRGCMKEVN